MLAANTKCISALGPSAGGAPSRSGSSASWPSAWGAAPCCPATRAASGSGCGLTEIFLLNFLGNIFCLLRPGNIFSTRVFVHFSYLLTERPD